MIRNTSIEAYHKIKDEGLLSKLRFDVYHGLFNHGPATALELFTKCFKETHRDHSITPRFSELNALGVVSEVEIRPCKISGRSAIVWDVTKKLPVKLEKEKKVKCNHCDGKGYTKTQQSKMF